MANALTLTPTTTGPVPTATMSGSTGMTGAGGRMMTPGGNTAHPLRRPWLTPSMPRDQLASVSTGKLMSTGPALTVMMSGGIGTMPAPSGGVTSVQLLKSTCGLSSQKLRDHLANASTGTLTITLLEPTATMSGTTGTSHAASGGVMSAMPLKSTCGVNGMKMSGTMMTGSLSPRVPPARPIPSTLLRKDSLLDALLELSPPLAPLLYSREAARPTTSIESENSSKFLFNRQDVREVE